MKIRNLVIIMLSLLMIASISGEYRVFAANTSDTAWQVSLLASDVNWKHATYRSKTNTTAAYIKGVQFTQTLTKARMRVWGATDINGSGQYNATSLGRKYYIMDTGVGHIMKNTVKEDGKSHATIAARSLSGTGNLTVLWSPDTKNESSYSQLPTED